jgi:hypothetical protein
VTAVIRWVPRLLRPEIQATTPGAVRSHRLRVAADLYGSDQGGYAGGMYS